MEVFITQHRITYGFCPSKNLIWQHLGLQWTFSDVLMCIELISQALYLQELLDNTSLKDN